MSLFRKVYLLVAHSVCVCECVAFKHFLLYIYIYILKNRI